MNRRELLKIGAATLATSAMAIPAVQAQTQVTRRSVTHLADNDPDLEAYRVAIREMSGLPETDPRNWARQAQIHLDQCPHNNWYFLPWHRAYLYAFESICRELSGKADFALPYWDWFIDRQMPVPFRGDPQSNVLAHERPGFAKNDSLPSHIYSEKKLQEILSSGTFEEFGSSRPQGQDNAEPQWIRRRGDATELEFSQHNGIHRRLNGDMASLLSPLDPIFWLHHCNLDRVWALWAGAHPGTVLNPLLADMKFEGHFTVPGGTNYAPQVRDLLETEALGYSYEPVSGINDLLSSDLIERIGVWQNISDDVFGGLSADFKSLENIDASAPKTAKPILLARGVTTAIANREKVISIPLTADRPMEELLGDLGKSQSGSLEILSVAKDQRVIARIDALVPPKALDTVINVFVNCDYLDSETPPDDPHFVTTISFFGTESHHGSTGNVSVSVDLTSALATVRGSGDLKRDQLVVQLQPIGGASTEDTSVSIGAVEAVIL